MTFADRETEALFTELLSKLGGILTMTTDADPVRTGGEMLLTWRVAGALARHPLLLGKAAFRLVALVATENFHSTSAWICSVGKRRPSTSVRIISWTQPRWLRPNPIRLFEPGYKRVCLKAPFGMAQLENGRLCRSV